MPTTNPNGIDGAIVVLEGMQVCRAADLIHDQLFDVVKDLSIAVEKGFCSGTAEDSRATLNSAIDRLTELRDHLDHLDYGDAEDAVFPLAVLFPQLHQASE